MATLKDIRKRIKSVQSTEKITKAMKMVAASKLRKAQDSVKKSRPYSLSIEEVISYLAMRIKVQGEKKHPLLEVRPVKKVLLIVFTSDKGLCGGLNASIIKKTIFLYQKLSINHEKVSISTIGKKGYEAFKRINFNILHNYNNILSDYRYKKLVEISQSVSQEYILGLFDSVFLVYNKFISALTQKLCVNQIFPIVPAQLIKGTSPVSYKYEPDQWKLLSFLVPKYFSTIIYQAILESIASEHGARMTAMDNASRNAKEMIDSLTLQYNRARQAAITRELMEIIGGAEALN